MNILTAIDFSPPTEMIIRVTAKMAKPMGAKVWLTHVAEPDPDFMGYEGGPDVVRDAVAKEYHQEHRDLQALAEKLRADDIDCTALLVQGAIVETIVRLAHQHEADLIIAGSHGRSAVYDILVGSISAGIIKNATCPVTLVPMN